MGRSFDHLNVESMVQLPRPTDRQGKFKCSRIRKRDAAQEDIDF